MQSELYEQYVRLKAIRKQEEATAILEEFIASFRSFEEKQAWTRDFLASGAFGHRIRRELYEQVVFPVLAEGYRREEAWSIEWLARLIYNGTAQSHAQVDGKTTAQLWRQVYALAPTEALRLQLLRENLSAFAFAQHEWDYFHAIIWDRHSTPQESYAEIMHAIKESRQLDTDRSHNAYLDDFERKVKEYFVPLTDHDAKNHQMGDPEHDESSQP